MCALSPENQLYPELLQEQHSHSTSRERILAVCSGENTAAVQLWDPQRKKVVDMTE